MPRVWLRYGTPPQLHVEAGRVDDHRHVVDEEREVAELQRLARRAGARAVVAVENEDGVVEPRLLAGLLEEEADGVVEVAEGVVLVVRLEGVPAQVVVAE